MDKQPPDKQTEFVKAYWGFMMGYNPMPEESVFNLTKSQGLGLIRQCQIEMNWQRIKGPKDGPPPKPPESAEPEDDSPQETQSLLL